MPVKSLHQVDLAVADVERSLSFYLGLLGPFEVEIGDRLATHRGTEEVTYLTIGEQALGFREADDGGARRYYGVGLEHFAITVEPARSSRRRIADASNSAHGSNYPIQEDRDIHVPARARHSVSSAPRIKAGIQYRSVPCAELCRKGS